MKGILFQNTMYISDLFAFGTENEKFCDLGTRNLNMKGFAFEMSEVIEHSAR